MIVWRIKWSEQERELLYDLDYNALAPVKETCRLMRTGIVAA